MFPPYLNVELLGELVDLLVRGLLAVDPPAGLALHVPGALDAESGAAVSGGKFMLKQMSVKLDNMGPLVSRKIVSFLFCSALRPCVSPISEQLYPDGGRLAPGPDVVFHLGGPAQAGQPPSQSYGQGEDERGFPRAIGAQDHVEVRAGLERHLGVLKDNTEVRQDSF